MNPTKATNEEQITASASASGDGTASRAPRSKRSGRTPQQQNISKLADIAFTSLVEDNKSTPNVHLPSHTHDWNIVLNGVAELLPAYAMDVMHTEVVSELKQMRERVTSFPPCSPLDQRKFTEQAAVLLDEVVGLYGDSKPSSIDFWVHVLDASTGGLLANLDTLTPRAKQAARVALEGKLGHMQLLVRTSPFKSPLSATLAKRMVSAPAATYDDFLSEPFYADAATRWQSDVDDGFSLAPLNLNDEKDTML